MLVFAKNSAGNNVVPLRIITSPKLTDPEYLDANASGRVYVSKNYNGVTPIVLEFAPGANGNVPPSSVLLLPIAEGGVFGITVGSHYIYEETSRDQGFVIDYFGLAAMGNANPVCHIVQTHIAQPGKDSWLLARDPASQGLLWVPLWVPTSTGYQPAINGYHDCNSSPAAHLAGSNTRLSSVNGLAVDTHGRLIELDQSSLSINIFNPGNQTGTVAPNVTIRGANTTLFNPVAMTIY